MHVAFSESDNDLTNMVGKGGCGSSAHTCVDRKHVQLFRIKHCFQGQVTMSIKGKIDVAK